MAMPETVMRDWAVLNREDQEQAAQFISLLAFRRQHEDASRASHKSRVQFDIWKGQIEVFDNFDDPLPGFEEYM